MEKLYSRYLLDEHPITFHPTLAVAIGVNEAILLQKLNLWLNCKPKEANGRAWIYNTYKSWQEQLPFFSESTIKRTIKSLDEKGLIIKGNFNKMKMDRTTWYSIDYEKLDKLVEKFEMNQPLGQNDTMSEVQNDLSNTNEYSMITNNGEAPAQNANKIAKLYGEFNNVTLTDEEYNKLITRYGKNVIDNQIQNLSIYIKSQGKKYKNYYATLLNWLRKDNAKEIKPIEKQKEDTESNIDIGGIW